jgi:hypothetical protein
MKHSLGGAGADTLAAGGGDDVLTGGAGNDSLDGATGIDTAVYSSLWANYLIVKSGAASFTITDKRAGTPDGADSILGVEKLNFSDVLALAPRLLSPPQSSLLRTIAGPSATFVTNDTDLLLSGTAGTSSLVNLFDGAVSLGTAIADVSGNWSFQTGVLTIGAHSFTAAAGDGSGHWGTSHRPLRYDHQCCEQFTTDCDCRCGDRRGGRRHEQRYAWINPTGNVLSNDTDPDSGDTQIVQGVAAGHNPARFLPASAQASRAPTARCSERGRQLQLHPRQTQGRCPSPEYRRTVERCFHLHDA